MGSIVPISASKRYNVMIDKGILPVSGSLLHEVSPKSEKVCLVTDDTVDVLYSDTVIQSLEENGMQVVKYVIPHGEASKTPENYFSLIMFLAENSLSTKDAVVALGGGVVGDLAGFAAATYRRGIVLCQIPTTVLAAVDSSVGGKTAVDLPYGKNLLGSFYQPDIVICDTDTFKTLPHEIYCDGCAEIIKYGCIWDRDLFESLEKNDMSYASGEEVIRRCVEIKRDVVEQDERDTGVRKILNFGHTIGHAIELNSDFTVNHGHAVAAGMVVITNYAYKKGYCSSDTLERLAELVKKYDLPDSTVYDGHSLATAMLADKKRAGSKLDFILLSDIGKCFVSPTDVDHLEEIVDAGLEK